MLRQREAWQREPGFDIGIFGKARPKTKNTSIVRGHAYHKRVYKALEGFCKKNADIGRLYVEPWLRGMDSRRMLQPDFVIVDELSDTAIVGEVKLNWKDGRDEKLINEYLWAVQTAFGVEMVWPALVTSNVAHLGRAPMLGLQALFNVDAWTPGAPTPVILHP